MILSYSRNIFYHSVTGRSNHRRCFMKMGVLKKFAKFTGEHLCSSLFFNQVAGFFYRTPPKGCFRNRYFINILKSDSHLPKFFKIICFNYNPSKMMKNAFYFILKAFFVLKIFKFLSWLFGHVGKTAWFEER